MPKSPLPSQHLRSDQEAIEKLVLARRPASTSTAITAYLRRHGKARPELVFQACDWFRRLGLHERGYRLLALEEPLERRASTRTFEGRRALWAARFLNLMGASEFAAALLDQISPETFDDHRIIGSIRLANLDFVAALSHLEAMRGLDPDPSRYLSRLSLLNLADAHSGMGDYGRALGIADDVRASCEGRTEERLLRGVALTAGGEYLARSGRHAESVAMLESALGSFPDGDRSPDIGVLLKWLGFARGKSGDAAGAEAAFTASIGILRGSGLRAEAWLDVLRLRAECGLLDSETTGKLLRYPGVSDRFRGILAGSIPESAETASEIPCEARAWIDLARDEYRLDGTLRLGIPVEIRLLAWLALSGDWGIPTVRLKNMLWPEEVFSYLQLEGRLHQLVMRLRNRHGAEVLVSERVIRLGPSTLDTIGVKTPRTPSLPGKDDRETLPSFLLAGRRRFTRSDVQRHYGLTSTPAWHRIREWLDRGWVRGVPHGASRGARLEYEPVHPSRESNGYLPSS